MVSSHISGNKWHDNSWHRGGAHQPHSNESRPHLRLREATLKYCYFTKCKCVFPREKPSSHHRSFALPQNSVPHFLVKSICEFLSASASGFDIDLTALGTGPWDHYPHQWIDALIRPNWMCCAEVRPSWRKWCTVGDKPLKTFLSPDPRHWLLLSLLFPPLPCSSSLPLSCSLPHTYELSFSFLTTMKWAAYLF